MQMPSSFYPRVFGLVVAAVLGYALILIFAPFVGPMTWAAFLAFLLYPLNLRLRRRFQSPGLAAGILALLAPIVILLPLSALSVQFIEQISALMQRTSEIHDLARHQVAVGSGTIPVDRPDERLVAGACGDFLAQSKFNPGCCPPRAGC